MYFTKNKNTLFYLAVIVALLPIVIFRDYTPDNELRYLSIADEAIRNGTFFSFTHQGEIYADKPPLYLWLIMLCKYLFGYYPMWFVSLFAIVPAFVIMRVMDRWVAEYMDSDSRFMAKVLLMSCGMYVGAVVVVRMDMLMCMFIVLALRTFYDMYMKKGNAKKNAFLFPLYLFLAVFTKGPLGLMIPLAATIVFLVVSKQIKRVFEFWGLKTWGVLLILFGAWFSLTYAEGGSTYLYNMVFHQTVDRAVDAFHHRRPFYHYAVSITYWSMLWTVVIISVVIAAFRQKLVQTELQKLFITTAATTFVVLSCISSKLDIYMLPLYPFLIYFTAMYLQKAFKLKLTYAGIALPALVFALVLPVFIVLTGKAAFAEYRQPVFFFVTAILTVSGVSALVFLFKKKQAASVKTLACGLACTVFAAGFAMDTVNPMIGYGTVCSEAKEKAESLGVPVLVDRKINEAADMDVYLKNMKLIDADSLMPYPNAKEVVIVKAYDGKLIKIR